MEVNFLPYGRRDHRRVFFSVSQKALCFPGKNVSMTLLATTAICRCVHLCDMTRCSAEGARKGLYGAWIWLLSEIYICVTANWNDCSDAAGQEKKRYCFGLRWRLQCNKLYVIARFGAKHWEQGRRLRRERIPSYGDGKCAHMHEFRDVVCGRCGVMCLG